MKLTFNHGRRHAGVCVVSIRLVGLAAMSALTIQASAAAASPGTVTFTKDIAPILQRSCQGCHRPIGGAPMSLLSYVEVRPWARAITERTSKREMPPWFIDKTVGIQAFKDDPSLSDNEIATIARWAASGAPQGFPTDMPPPRHFPDAGQWLMGTPDLVVSMPVVTLKAVMPDQHRTLGPTPTGLTEDRYVKAVEVREVKVKEEAGATSGPYSLAVHHAQFYGTVPEIAGQVSTDATSGNGEEGAPGFGHEDFYYTYEVGQNALRYPQKVGVRLRAGSVLTANNHFHAIGREVTVRIEIAFQFQPKGFQPQFKHPTDKSLSVSLTDEIDIPPGQDNVRLDSFKVLQEPIMMVTFEPHLHTTGKRMCYKATYPNGRQETLNCAGYNHNWVKTYTYQDDVAPLLPKGTMLQITAWYDNSSANKRNPEPRNWKGYGNRTIDDMHILLSTTVRLTEEEYQAEVAARAARKAAKDHTSSGQ
jgi:hypothetical protein